MTPMSPFDFLAKENEVAEESKKQSAKRTDDRKLLRELSKMLRVAEADIPRTLQRMKKEIEGKS